MADFSEILRMARGAHLSEGNRAFNRHSKLMSPDAREAVLKTRATEIEAFANDRGLEPAIVAGVAEAAMRIGRVPDMRQYGLSDDQAKAVEHFIAGDILNLAIEDENKGVAEATVSAGAGAHMQIKSAFMARPRALVDYDKWEKGAEDQEALKVEPRVGVDFCEKPAMTIEDLARLQEAKKNSAPKKEEPADEEEEEEEEDGEDEEGDGDEDDDSAGCDEAEAPVAESMAKYQRRLGLLGKASKKGPEAYEKQAPKHQATKKQLRYKLAQSAERHRKREKSEGASFVSAHCLSESRQKPATVSILRGDRPFVSEADAATAAAPVSLTKAAGKFVHNGPELEVVVWPGKKDDPHLVRVKQLYGTRPVYTSPDAEAANYFAWTLASLPLEKAEKFLRQVRRDPQEWIKWAYKAGAEFTPTTAQLTSNPFYRTFKKLFYKKYHETEQERGAEEETPEQESIAINEVSPPGWHGTVAAMRKHKELDSPWALAWSMKKKGFKPHYKDQPTSLKGEPKKKAKYKDEK
jgi:hypothetical protein